MTGQLEFLELLNKFLERKGERLEENQVTFGEPVKLSSVVAQAYDRNTRLLITSTVDPTDTATVYYNRLELPILFGEDEVPVDIDFYTVEDAVERLNSLYGSNIEMDELKSFEMLPGYKARIVIGKAFKYLEDTTLLIYPKTDLTHIEEISDRYHTYIHFTLPNSLEGVPDEPNAE